MIKEKIFSVHLEGGLSKSFEGKAIPKVGFWDGNVKIDTTAM